MTENNGKTGWPAGLLQDDDNRLSKWFASRLDARQKVREALWGSSSTSKPEYVAEQKAKTQQLRDMMDGKLL